LENELFGTIRDNYFMASSEIWRWNSYQNFFVRFIVFPWLIVVSIIMKTIGFLFGLGVILDLVSVWLQKTRNSVVHVIESSAYNLRYEAFSYFTSPVKSLILAPIVLFLGIIPKWSSTIAVAIHPDLDVSYGIEHGYFIKAGKAYLKLSKMLFICINKHGILVGIFALIIATIFSPITLLIAFFFFSLIILDWIGWLVGLLRKFVVSSSMTMANLSGKNIGTVVLMPILLTLFVPVYIALLLIPKIATYDEN